MYRDNVDHLGNIRGEHERKALRLKITKIWQLNQFDVNYI
jgi:hypothetical protein